MRVILKTAIIAAITVMAFSLTACDQLYLYPHDLELGIEKCEGNGGVEKFFLESTGSSSRDLSYVNTYCKNGVTFKYYIEDAE